MSVRISINGPAVEASIEDGKIKLWCGNDLLESIDTSLPARLTFERQFNPISLDENLMGYLKNDEYIALIYPNKLMAIILQETHVLVGLFTVDYSNDIYRNPPNILVGDLYHDKEFIALALYYYKEHYILGSVEHPISIVVDNSNSHSVEFLEKLFKSDDLSISLRVLNKLIVYDITLTEYGILDGAYLVGRRGGKAVYL